MPEELGEAELPADLTYAVIRTMVAAALADGVLAIQEKQAIQDQLGTSGLSQERVAQIQKDLLIPALPAELAALVSDQQEREALYRSAVLVTRADLDVVDAERDWLRKLATALGFDESRRQALETDLAAVAS